MSDAGLVTPGPITQLLDPTPADLDPSEADVEVFASANQLEDLSAEASDDDRYPLQPLPSVSSLPDIQRAAKPSSSASSLERKHSLPASANKRVQILEPGEVEQLLGRAVPRGMTAAMAIPGAARSPGSGSGPPGALGMPGTSGTSGSPRTLGTLAEQEIPGPSGMPGTSGISGSHRMLGTLSEQELPGPSGMSGTSGTSGSPRCPGMPESPGPPVSPGGNSGPPGMGESPGPPGLPPASVSPSQRRIEAQREARRRRQ